MSKTIKQIADELGVSKQAVTKCIDNLGLRSTLTKTANCFVVGDSQEKAIKQAFSAHQTANQNANQNANQPPTELAVIIDVLQTTIDTLQGQLAVKDEQIKGLQAQIEQLTATLQQQTSALTAAQTLHAADKKTLLAIEDKQNEPKRHWWQRRKERTGE